MEYTVDEYFKVKTEYEKGIFTSEQWTFYCISYLHNLMIKYPDKMKEIEK